MFNELAQLRNPLPLPKLGKFNNSMSYKLSDKFLLFFTKQSDCLNTTIGRAEKLPQNIMLNTILSTRKNIQHCLTVYLNKLFVKQYCNNRFLL